MKRFFELSYTGGRLWIGWGVPIAIILIVEGYRLLDALVSNACMP